MKRIVYLLIISCLVLSLPVEAQRRSSEKSRETKSRVETNGGASNKKAVRSEPPKKRVAQESRASSGRRITERKPAWNADNQERNRTAREKPARVPAARETSRERNTQAGSTRERTVNREGNIRSDRPYNTGNRNQPAVMQRNTRSNQNRAIQTPQNSRANRTGERDNRINRRVVPGERDAYHSTRQYVHRHTARYGSYKKPASRSYRARWYPYRVPAHVHVVWSRDVYIYYRSLYPIIDYWGYYPGYRVHTISAYEVYNHVGHIRTVYGKVFDTFYSYDTDEYFLYVGSVYPYHDFTIVVPGIIARRYARNPERYFMNEHVHVTGLITDFEGVPEIVVGKKSQLHRY